uniref:Uncharacterized protein n=1 Tax=Arundo donax TaxID=35708 RepID=A0A0A9EBM6_ARUDO
MGWRRWGSPG